MRRRDFVFATASVAGLPRWAQAAVPCPPGTLSVTGGSNASTSCGGASSYNTDFPLTENPISEGGSWAQHGKTTGLDWSNVRTAGGIAFGTQTGANGYDDSIALLSGFGANQRISGIVSLTGSRSSSTSTHEVELILRGAYSAHQQYMYECLLGYSGASSFYFDIVRHNGALGSFNSIGQLQVGGYPSVSHGDEIMAQMVGSTIEFYHNNNLIVAATDTSFTTGQPGIGFFWRGTENDTDFAFSSITATSL